MTTRMIFKVIRHFQSFPLHKDITAVKLQVLDWANQFNTCSFFDNNQYASAHNSYECLVGVGVKRSINAAAGKAFDLLKNFYDEEPDWLFGHFGYDLKNELEQLASAHPDGVQFPDLFFFAPEYIIKLNKSEILINSETDITPVEIWEQIRQMQSLDDPPLRSPDRLSDTSSSLHILSRFTKEEYTSIIKCLQAHILKGDCYEINFCQEFYAEDALLYPLTIYRNLCAVSPNPFSAYYRLEDKYLLCASPERYIKKIKNRIISQPIKGTIKRDPDNGEGDSLNRERLFSSEKDRAENIMTVDLVRNDLSRICEEGSVVVDELFGIYSFPQVYQMISTISGEISDVVHWTDIIRATFPMGSMTGAPKKKVMELIEQYERTQRGIYSGALGYITPDGDFDFNVVIRSIALNTTRRYLSYQVGSAITFNSNAEQEYEECLVKASAIQKTLGPVTTF